MIRRFLPWISVFSLILVVGCRSSSNVSDSNATLPSEMDNMAQDVRKLLPYIYDRKAYADPKNRETIDKSLREFAQAAHTINPDKAKPYLGDDLLVEFSLNHLKDDLNRAAYTFEIGQTEYSRSVAKASLTHCFRCHSATPEKGSNTWDIEQVHNLNLEPLEKADLLVATRKFNKALEYMENLVNSPDFAKNYAFDVEGLLRRYLAMIIRVEKDPMRALKRLKKFATTEETPHYIAEQAEAWRQSLKAWSKEKKVSIRNAKDLFREADNRFKRAESMQRYEKDHAGDVEYLRVTGLLHENMKYLKKPEEQARAFFLLGRAYEVLDELGSWNLHESYYEGCLLKDPKSKLAHKCYSRLEASLYLGYSGSAGTHLPPEERARLKALKEKME